MDDHEAIEDVTISMELGEGYQFLVDFGVGGVAELIMDEPPPLGAGHGPNATRVLAAAVGNCLSASALYCLRKARVPVKNMRTTVRASLVRNQGGRLRLGGLRIELHPEVQDADLERLNRCMELFEDFCVVTESVRDGIEVKIDVQPVGIESGQLHDPQGGGPGLKIHQG